MGIAVRPALQAAAAMLGAFAVVAGCSKDRSRPDPSTVSVLLPAVVDAGAPGDRAEGPPRASAMPSLAPLVERTRPAVVNIVAATLTGGGYVRDPWGRRYYMSPQERDSLGSGFLIDAEARVLTNWHVVKDADRIRVELDDGREFPATLVGSEPDIDLALLDIEAEGLPWLELGDSDGIRVGDYVVAIGTPLGLANTVTAGIVSAVGREITEERPGYADFIQTDASINQGNSGGPLVDLEGRVIGINTAISGQGQGIGFAVPINMAKQVLPQLLAHGEVTRAWFGMLWRSLGPGMARKIGIDAPGGPSRAHVWVVDVVPGGPAAEGGLQANDVILRVGDKPIERPALFQWIASTSAVGRPVEIEVWRNGGTKVLRVVPIAASNVMR